MTSGWTCPSCGVNYAPSVTKCDCSRKPKSSPPTPEKPDDLAETIRRWKEAADKIERTPPTWPDPNDIWRQPWPTTTFISPEVPPAKILCHDGRNWITIEGSH